MTIRQLVRGKLRDGTLTPLSPLTEVPGTGPYLSRRLTAAMAARRWATCGARRTARCAR